MRNIPVVFDCESIEREREKRLKTMDDRMFYKAINALIVTKAD